MRDAVTILGAGGHAKVIVALLRALGREVTACIVEQPELWGTTLLGVPVRGPTSALEDGTKVVLGIGNNDTRRRLAALSFDWQTLVHPRACVDPSVTLGRGAVVFAGAVVQAEARIGAHAIVNTAASIDHDCVLGDYSHVGPGAHLAGDVRLDEGAFIATGAAVIPGRHIGAWAIVGAGAAVIEDVAAGATVVGVPARPIHRDRGSEPR